MKIHKFENLYPRIFWVVVMDEEDPIKLLNKFYFFVNLPGWNTINKSIEDDLNTASVEATAGCYPVQDKMTGKIGVLLVIFNSEETNTDIIAHESVHIADYYYEACGCNSEGFTDGNEAYAYLVGWAAGCIANVLIKEKA